jgi:multiple sugar transport system permease protein
MYLVFFLAPWFVGFFCFLLGPIIASFLLSFTDFDGLKQLNFQGAENYSRVLEDPQFFASLGVTIKFALISLPLGTVVAIALALVLNKKTFGISWFRTALYLPSVIPIVASSVVWIWIFKGDWLPDWLSDKFPGWLSDPNWALPALMIMSLWSLGNPMIIYLAGLQNIPKSLYEAAEIDGANEFDKLWHISLPLLSPTIFFNVVIGIIQVFQYFVPAYVMTSGGPKNSTLFYSLYAYQVAFEDFQMGYASALSWILFVIVLFTTLIAFMIKGRQ